MGFLLQNSGKIPGSAGVSAAAVWILQNNTPVQYLDYLAALKNMPKQTAKEKIEQLLELVGLSDVADKKMKNFPEE